jgi:hypothetical protein
VYLPVLAVSILVMLPFLRRVDRPDRGKPLMNGAVVVLLLSLVALALSLRVPAPAIVGAAGAAGATGTRGGPGTRGGAGTGGVGFGDSVADTMCSLRGHPAGGGRDGDQPSMRGTAPRLQAWPAALTCSLRICERIVRRA